MNRNALKEKILQTVVAKISTDKPLPKDVGAGFFFGEIIKQADEMGIEKAKEFLEEFKASCKIPPLITSDFENGCGSMLKGLTVLPYMMSLGAADSEQLAYDYGKATAIEARSVGANWTFSPVADLNINYRNPLVNFRSAGDNPDAVSKIVQKVVMGMQENGLAACAKHFPGDGLDFRDQHIVTTNNTLPFNEWKEKSGKVFENVINNGVYSIMAGHITLPSYQKNRTKNGMFLPATLSDELIDKLLKKEMGFKGVVVTDALDMGGFNGWYKTREQSELESFRAGCDMVLWPSEKYVDNIADAIENGYIPIERLNDAYDRVMQMKEKLGLFNSSSNTSKAITEQEKFFVKSVRDNTAEKSITLVRDNLNAFPLSNRKVKKIAVSAIVSNEVYYNQAQLLCDELKQNGFEVDFYQGCINDTQIDEHDLVIYTLFSKPHFPIGFYDFQGKEAIKIHISFHYGAEKSAVVSFGSPYFGEIYFERADTYVNAYSPVDASVKAFVKAITGQIPFTNYSPVKIKNNQFEK